MHDLPCYYPAWLRPMSLVQMAIVSAVLHHVSSPFIIVCFQLFSCLHLWCFNQFNPDVLYWFHPTFHGYSTNPSGLEPQQIRWWSFAIDFYVVVKFTPATSTQPSTLVSGWFNQLNPNRSEGRWKSSSPSGHFWPPASRSQHPRLIKSVSRWLPLIKSTAEAPITSGCWFVECLEGMFINSIYIQYIYLVL